MVYKVILLIYICLLLSLTLNAQNKDCEYHSLVNDAELNIVQGKYKAALDAYDKAFKNNTIKFSTDVYNAIVCADKVNNKSKILQYTDKLANIGINSKFFERQVFKKFVNDKSFQKIIQKAQKQKDKKETTAKSYLAAIDTLFKLDQYYNRTRLTKYANLPELPRELDSLFEKNTHNLLNLIKSDGFYSEDKLGIITINDTTIKSGNVADIILLHYLEMGSNTQLKNHIKQMLLNNVYNGITKPANAENIIEMTYGLFKDIGKWNFNRHSCKLYRKKQIDELDEINAARQEYCLETLEDLEKKFIYRYSKNSKFIFINTVISLPVHDYDFFNTAFQEVAAIKDCK